MPFNALVLISPDNCCYVTMKERDKRLMSIDNFLCTGILLCNGRESPSARNMPGFVPT